MKLEKISFDEYIDLINASLDDDNLAIWQISYNTIRIPERTLTGKYKFYAPYNFNIPEGETVTIPLFCKLNQKAIPFISAIYIPSIESAQIRINKNGMLMLHLKGLENYCVSKGSYIGNFVIRK